MNNEAVKVGAWAVIEDDCPISFVADEEAVEFAFGAKGTNIQLITAAGALEKLLNKGTEALRMLNTRP